MNIEEVTCWSCDKTITLDELSENDGFCPCCECEIELDEH